MEISETCQMDCQLGLLPEDSLASLSVLPGSAEAQAMTVGSGRKWLELLNVSDLCGFWLKMCLESSAWNSTRCYLTWNASTTPHGRLLFRLSASMPRTEETEFGLWPTPTKAIADGGQSSRSGKRKGELLLTGMARLWPTPKARDYRTGDRPEHRRARAKQSGQWHSPDLNDVASPGGQLNPNWVEWLMGYPPGWTDLED